MTTRLVTPDDLRFISSPDDLAQLFQKLNYEATAQSIAVEDLELPTRSSEAIQDAYLLADYKQGVHALQILLFKLYPPEFSSASLVRNRMKMIANSLCNRSNHYLLIATKDYKQFLLSSPRRALDEQLNLVVSVESCLINLASSSYQECNWLEKIAARGLPPQALHEVHQKTFKDAHEIQKAHLEDSFTEDSIRLYLNEIGRIRLLRADEEIELARKIADLMGLEGIRVRLTEELRREPQDKEWASEVDMPLTAFRHRIHLGRRAKDKMVQSNLRLVVSIAKHYTNRGVELQDLIQEGSLGLIRAAEKFDPELGYKFATYATWWIRQGITRAIHNDSRLIRLPVHLCETEYLVQTGIKKLCLILGRQPTEIEIANYTEIDVKKLRLIKKWFQKISSLDSRVSEDKGISLGDLITSEENLEESIYQQWLHEEVEKRLGDLSFRDCDILKRRFGFYSSGEQTLQDIGEVYRLTRERIRQIEAKTLRKLKHLLIPVLPEHLLHAE